jgi:hypothetical protein
MTLKTFIDLTGASGAAFRFRLWEEDTMHLPMAGNYVFVREDAAGFKVVLIGVTNDLSTVRFRERRALSRGPVHIYTRLNVSRGVRTAEHEDLVAHYKPSSVHIQDT